MRKRTYWIDTSSPIQFAVIRYIAAWIIILLTQFVFYLCNIKLFPICETSVVELLKGIFIYTIATTSILLSPFILLTTIPFKRLAVKRWYRTITEITYIIPILFAIIVGSCNAPYYQFTYKRLSAQIFTYLTNCGDYGSLLPHFIIDYWEAIISIIVLSIMLIVICRKIHFNRKQYEIIHIKNGNTWRRNGFRILVFIIAIGILHITSHGGIKKQLIDTSEMGRHCELSYSALVIPDALNIINTLIDNDIEDIEIKMETDLNWFDPMFISQATANGNESDTTISQNVVLLILESFSQEYMGCYNPHTERSHTPFIDSLAKISTIFQGQANGKQSIEGIPAILSSMPTLIETPYINSRYYQEHQRSLPQILNEHGYHTAFYHGGENGIMNFDKYCLDIGFSHYYGENEYYSDGGSPNDHDGSWGIYDQPYLQYFANRLNKTPQPFFCCAYTLSSHHPYSIPDSIKQNYPEREHPILKCVEYTDNAVRQLFESIKDEPWFRNTLFIITSDHCGPNISKNYIKKNGLYRIPVIFYHPADSTAQQYDRIVQQTDIMPTLIDYLGIKDSAICFGTSLYQNPDQGWSITYGNGVYTINTKKGTLHFNSKDEQYIPIEETEPNQEDSINLSRQGRSIVHQYKKYLSQPQQTKGAQR